MGAKVDALRSLQDIELQIVDIEQQCARIERRVAAQERKIRTMDRDLDKQREELRREEVRLNTLEVDVAGRTANIDKLREHLNSVRTNKEYADILADINNQKADTTKVESEAMEVMEVVETRRKDLDEHDANRAKEVSRMEELKQELVQLRQTFSPRLTKLEAQKQEALDGIDRSVITLFERVSERYDGEVLAEVVRPNPRLDEFRCNGCHMQLRADVANALLVKDEVMTCKVCGRILFMTRSS